jgi:hypothetical protein
MAVRLSALRADLPLPPGRFLVLISVRGWVDPRNIVRLEGLGKLKKSNDLIGNRTGVFPACSIAPLFLNFLCLDEDGKYYKSSCLKHLWECVVIKLWRTSLRNHWEVILHFQHRMWTRSAIPAVSLNTQVPYSRCDAASQPRDVSDRQRFML